MFEPAGLDALVQVIEQGVKRDLTAVQSSIFIGRSEGVINDYVDNRGWVTLPSKPRGGRDLTWHCLAVSHSE